MNCPTPPLLDKRNWNGIITGRKDLDSSKYSYKLNASQYGIDIAFSDTPDFNESEMSLWIPYAQGGNKDGVGDVVEVEGIDFQRHRLNPISLFDHSKSVALPIGVTENPKTKEYTNVVDPIAKTAKVNCWFYQGKGLKGVEKSQEFDHAIFCQQLYDLSVKGFVRSGSLGYQVIEAEEIPPDYTRGIPKGLWLKKTLMLEASLVVLPANMLTVRQNGVKSFPDYREVLSMPTVCGKKLSPILFKPLSQFAEPAKVMMGYQKANPAHDENMEIDAKEGIKYISKPIEAPNYRVTKSPSGRWQIVSATDQIAIPVGRIREWPDEESAQMALRRLQGKPEMKNIPHPDMSKTDIPPSKWKPGEGASNKELPSNKIPPKKACQMLEDGEANGKPLTDKQRGAFGASCSKLKSLRGKYGKKSYGDRHYVQEERGQFFVMKPTTGSGQGIGPFQSKEEADKRANELNNKTGNSFQSGQEIDLKDRKNPGKATVVDGSGSDIKVRITQQWGNHPVGTELTVSPFDIAKKEASKPQQTKTPSHSGQSCHRGQTHASTGCSAKKALDDMDTKDLPTHESNADLLAQAVEMGKQAGYLSAEGHQGDAMHFKEQFQFWVRKQGANVLTLQQAYDEAYRQAGGKSLPAYEVKSGSHQGEPCKQGWTHSATGCNAASGDSKPQKTNQSAKQEEKKPRNVGDMADEFEHNEDVRGLVVTILREGHNNNHPARSILRDKLEELGLPRNAYMGYVIAALIKRGREQGWKSLPAQQTKSLTVKQIDGEKWGVYEGNKLEGVYYSRQEAESIAAKGEKGLNYDGKSLKEGDRVSTPSGDGVIAGVDSFRIGGKTTRRFLVKLDSTGAKQAFPIDKCKPASSEGTSSANKDSSSGGTCERGQTHAQTDCTPKGKSLDLRKKYRNSKTLRRKLKSSRPGASVLWVSGSNLDKCKQLAAEKGLEFSHIGSQDSMAKVKLIGDDNAIDSVAKAYGSIFKGKKSIGADMPELAVKKKDLGDSPMADEEIAQDVEATEDIDDVADEKYSAQVLRRMHEDARLLLEQYDDLAGPLEHEEIANQVKSKCEALVSEIEEIEAMMQKHHPESKALEGADVGEDNSPAEEADSGEPERPTPEEALEGMETKELRNRYIKALQKSYKKTPVENKTIPVEGKKGICPDCAMKGKESCSCSSKPDAEGKLNEMDKEADVDKSGKEMMNEMEPLEAMDDKVEVTHKKSLMDHEKPVVSEAKDFLHQAAEGNDWTREHQMKSYHFHKSLDAMVGGMGIEGDHIPGDEAPTGSVMETKGMDAEEKLDELDTEAEVHHKDMPGDVPNDDEMNPIQKETEGEFNLQKCLSGASMHFKSLSGMDYLDDSDKDQSKHHAEQLGKALDAVDSDMGEIGHKDEPMEEESGMEMKNLERVEQLHKSAIEWHKTNAELNRKIIALRDKLVTR